MMEAQEQTITTEGGAQASSPVQKNDRTLQEMWDDIDHLRHTFNKKFRMRQKMVADIVLSHHRYCDVELKWSESPFDIIKRISINREIHYVYNTVIDICSSDDDDNYGLYRINSIVSGNDVFVSNLTKLQIIINYPCKTVTNEHDDSVRVYDVFCKFYVLGNGCLKDYPVYIRSTFPMSQFRAGYIHSHIPHVSSTLSYFTWSKGCYGSSDLKYITDRLLKSHEDYCTWLAFIVELGRFLEVESIAGVPYTYMSNINAVHDMNPINDIKPCCSCDINTSNVDVIVKYMLREGNLKFSFDGFKYVLDMSDRDFYIEATKSFLKAYKDRKIYICTSYEDLDSNYMQTLYVMDDGRLSKTDSSGIVVDMSVVGRKVLTFRGKDIPLKVFNDGVDSDNVKNIRVIQDFIACIVMFRLLLLVNVLYGKRNRFI